MEDISNYEVLCFLNNTGLTHKVMNYKKGEPLKDFIGNLQQVINKILKSSSGKGLISQYSFDFKYAQFSRKQFFYKANILQRLQREVLVEKVDRWRKVREEEVCLDGLGKKELRRMVRE